MYIRSIWIQNIRSLEDLDWIPYTSMQAGWHVIIGDNGSGKTTFLHAIALALIGPYEALPLGQDWSNWVRKGEERGVVQVHVGWDEGYDKFSEATPNGFVKRPDLPMKVRVRPNQDGGSLGTDNTRWNPKHYGWGRNPGWFSASYGPFRRFTGGDPEFEQSISSNPKIVPHLSLFRESFALTECLTWLQSLRFKELEGDPEDPEGHLLKPLMAFINHEGFLPHETRLEKVTSRGVTFVDGNGCEVLLQDLSDGYRSVLSMTLELIRQLALHYGQGSLFAPDDPTRIVVPGVVLIDEVDAHLHPTWQRRIGLWFREHFPQIQFIVTTHSPLVCQAADVGTVYRLPKPGSGEKGQMITGTQLNRLLYGNILDAYGTEVFGADVTRSEASKKRLSRLAELNCRELQTELSPEEQREQEELRAMLPTTAHIQKPV